MKTFIAEPVIIPNDLSEKYDEQVGNKPGHLRNLLADRGKLREIDEELLALGLMSKVKEIMQSKDLPDGVKPLSIGRLSNVIYVIMFAYCTGTMRVTEDYDVTFGEGLEDVQKAMELALSDKIKFVNGKTMPTKEFMVRLRNIADPDAIKDTYSQIVKRHGLTKDISAKEAFHVAKVSIVTAKMLMDGKTTVE